MCRVEQVILWRGEGARWWWRSAHRSGALLAAESRTQSSGRGRESSAVRRRAGISALAVCAHVTTGRVTSGESSAGREVAELGPSMGSTGPSSDSVVRGCRRQRGDACRDDTWNYVFYYYEPAT